MSGGTLGLWRRIALEVYRSYGARTNRGSLCSAHTRLLRQQALLRLAGINRRSRDAFIEAICREVVVVIGSSDVLRHSVESNWHIVARAQALVIKIDGQQEHRMDALVEQLIGCLPPTLNMLEAIIIDTDMHCKPPGNSQSRVEHQVEIPRLASVHVIQANLDRHEQARWMDTWRLTQIIARLAMKQPSELLSTINFDVDIAVMPMWVDRSSLDSARPPITLLMFTDMAALSGAVDLVRSCHKSLIKLAFWHCDFNQLEPMFYANDGPVQYPRLRHLQGALCQSNTKHDFGIPQNALPSLEYINEIVAHRWQYKAGVVSHLLVNTLMEIRLPRLWMLRLRTSPHMSLKMENLPMLRYVYYYTVSELPELLDGYVVVQQLQRLLQMPTLRHLQLHDQLPTVNVLAKLQVNCLDLQCLDIGMIVLSFGNIVHLLQALGRLHTFVFAIRNIWAPAPGIDLVRVQALSESVQLLRMYVVGRMRHSPVLLPTEEIVSRLPRLAKIQLQDGIAAMQDFVRRMKAEQRFAWSAAVADRVSIAKVDMLDKQM